MITVKKKKSVIKRNRILILFLFVFVTYISVTLINQQVKIKELDAVEAQYMEKIEELSEEVDSIEKEIEKSKSEEAIERLAREKLKMVKPDEVIYDIDDEVNPE